MFSKYQRNKIMKSIIKNWNDEHKFLDPNVICTDCKKDSKYVKDILYTLDSMNYISFKQTGSQTKPFITLHPSGKCYFETLSDERFKSFITPITITLATNGILYLIKLWLPSIKEWFLSIKIYFDSLM